MQADGGWERVVWIPQEVKERIGEFIPSETVDKIATENDVSSLDELKAFLREKGHPIVERWVEAPAAEEPREITVPTMEMPAGALPIQGMPADTSYHTTTNERVLHSVPQAPQSPYSCDS